MAPQPQLAATAATTTLTPKQLQVIHALAAGASLSTAAEDAGIHRSTIYEWRAQPEFRSALEGARQARAEALREDTVNMASLATDALRNLLTDPSTPASVRLKAALSVLQSASYTPPPPPRLNPQHFTNAQLDHFFDAIYLAAEKEMTASGGRLANLREPILPRAIPTPLDANNNNIARNASCPCGSGLKFKRCCGRAAPPILQSGSVG